MSIEEELPEFNLSLKKKKKKAQPEPIEDSNEVPEDEDYCYADLLGRFYDRLEVEHPSLMQRKRAVVPLPVVYKEGSKKTGVSNYPAILSALRRTPDHLQRYMMAELSTESSIDAKTCLILKGKFSQRQLTTILEKYIVSYVSCKGCKSHNTTIVKDPITRLSVLTCEECKASRSVDPLKA
jgi:translation initiation factor 2 subunit 2